MESVLKVWVPKESVVSAEGVGVDGVGSDSVGIAHDFSFSSLSLPLSLSLSMESMLKVRVPKESVLEPWARMVLALMAWAPTESAQVVLALMESVGKA
jgi:hypothetical protein